MDFQQKLFKNAQWMFLNRTANELDMSNKAMVKGVILSQQNINDLNKKAITSAEATA